MSTSTSEHLGNLKAKNFPLTEFAALLMHTQQFVVGGRMRLNEFQACALGKLLEPLPQVLWALTLPQAQVTWLPPVLTWPPQVTWAPKWALMQN
jgi:hypothetical protein